MGNSFSGIIEAPSLGIYTINIGDRQKERVRGNSVLDVPCEASRIAQAMQLVLRLHQCVRPVNPYYHYLPDTAVRYYEATNRF